MCSEDMESYSDGSDATVSDSSGDAYESCADQEMMESSSEADQELSESDELMEPSESSDDLMEKAEADQTEEQELVESSESEVNEELMDNGLTEAEKEEYKAETGWSDEIIDSARSKEELDVYRNADLKEGEINGKKCLMRDDIDMDEQDEFGETNRMRIEEGKSPITKSGETVELHHIGQKQESPLAELTTQEHRGKGVDTVLHDKQKDSEINRSEFTTERKNYWKARAFKS